ncbi:ABC transporter permease [Haladaptatus caseinilyticus]|uniref:ABC transporter permease n=1 Tax=Haladaptatus caseinilyticus TaxID=2993314 RepID=UPI00224AD0B0|nr:ABC transporter permease [Haladaptatus caseinilyticus]
MKPTEEDARSSESLGKTQSDTGSIPPADVATDGGQLEHELFTTTAEDRPSYTRKQRLSRLLDAYVYAPMSVAWADWRVRIGGIILLFFFLMGTVGPYVVPEPRTLQGPIFLEPFVDMTHPLGTGVVGKDMVSQIVHSTPAMLKMITAGALFSVVVATLIGTVSGYKGGKVDSVLMSFTDVVLTVPGLALVLVIASVFPPKSPWIVGLILGIDNWPGLARTIRSQVLSIREEEYVEASRAMGLSKWHIIRKDLISQLMPYISINTATSARNIIFESVALYFLGILPMTSLNWGVLLNTAYQESNLRSPENIHFILIPMFTIALISLGFVLFAQGMDRVFNVRLRAKHAKRVGGDDEGAELNDV